MKSSSLLQVFFWLLLLSRAVSADNVAFEDRVREIASELRCVVCQNLSVADSPSEMATQMRGIVRQQLQQGKSAEEIKAYFVSKYGEWVLLAPRRSGFSLTVWILPFLVLGVGLLWAIWILYRWSRPKPVPPKTDADPVLLQRVRDEITSGEVVAHPASTAKTRVYADLRELEQDRQAGKLSDADYHSLRDLYESQAALILAEERAQKAPAIPSPAHDKVAEASRTPVARRGWVLAVGATVLLVGGVALGLLLGESVRPRTSTEDSITGDFLTGTGGLDRSTAAQEDVTELLSRGQTAFEKKELKTAIDSFKAVLSTDPGNPLANAYMGLILAQAGHSDAALLALDRALLRAPRLPMALWAKGMILYRDKQDLAGANSNLRALVQLLPPGEEKAAIQNTIDQIEKEKGGSGQAGAEDRRLSLSGRILIDPKLLAEVDPGSVLFIIARTPGSKRGPPLAVARVTSPSFPHSFTLGASNVMIPGTPFNGSVDLLVRLDKDGNPMTREPGSLAGSYQGNPVAVGTQDLEITIDEKVGE